MGTVGANLVEQINGPNTRKYSALSLHRRSRNTWSNTQQNPAHDLDPSQMQGGQLRMRRTLWLGSCMPAMFRLLACFCKAAAHTRNVYKSRSLHL